MGHPVSKRTPVLFIFLPFRWNREVPRGSLQAKTVTEFTVAISQPTWGSHQLALLLVTDFCQYLKNKFPFLRCVTTGWNHKPRRRAAEAAGGPFAARSGEINCRCWAFAGGNVLAVTCEAGAPNDGRSHLDPALAVSWVPCRTPTRGREFTLAAFDARLQHSLTRVSPGQRTNIPGINGD